MKGTFSWQAAGWGWGWGVNDELFSTRTKLPLLKHPDLCLKEKLSQCHTQYLMPHYSVMFSHIKSVCPLPDAESWKIVLYMQPLLT